jgi:hypothetical protein
MAGRPRNILEFEKFYGVALFKKQASVDLYTPTTRAKDKRFMVQGG